MSDNNKKKMAAVQTAYCRLTDVEAQYRAEDQDATPFTEAKKKLLDAFSEYLGGE